MNMRELLQAYKKLNENEAEDICSEFYWKMQDLQHELFDQMIEACKEAKKEDIFYGKEVIQKFADKMNKYHDCVLEFGRYLDHLENELTKENKDEDEIEWDMSELKNMLEDVKNILKG